MTALATTLCHLSRGGPWTGTCTAEHRRMFSDVFWRMGSEAHLWEGDDWTPFGPRKPMPEVMAPNV